MTEKGKFYPLKLPKDFHGQVKPRKAPSQLYLDKRSERGEEWIDNNKISNWKRKILDKDVISERQQFLVHPAKISLDNPDWVKSTYHHFQRNYASVGKKQTPQERKQYDVFGNSKIKPARYDSLKEGISKVEKVQPEIAPKIGYKSYHQEVYQTSKKIERKEVTGKVGILEHRQNNIKRPQFKIGSPYANNYVDTYTVN